MTQLTAVQQRVYDFVREELQSGRTSPSLREIAAHFGWTSTRGAAEHIERLVASGWLTSNHQKARSLQLVQKVETPLPGLRVPIFGVVPKGFGVSRYREADEFLPVTVDLIGFKPTRHTFALRVKDDSMIGKHLCEGDIVVLEHGAKPRSGNIVAAFVGEKSILRTLLKQRGKTFLRSRNPQYPHNIPVEKVVIQGVFKALIRRMNESANRDIASTLNL